MNTHRNLNVSSDRLARSMERLSSGLRINRAADDAAGLGISEKMRAQIRGLDMANRNSQDGISLLQTLDGALNEVHSILQRARELALQYNNAYGQRDRRTMLAITTEVIALSNEIGRIMQVTDFNGIDLLRSGAVRMTLQVGANSNETMTFALATLMAPVNSLVRRNTFFFTTVTFADVAGFDRHIQDVSLARARFGSIQNRLEHTIASNNNYRENLMASESRIRDVDVAFEMTTLTKQQILQQTGTSMLMFANNSPKRLLDLLAPEDKTSGLG